MFSPPADDTCNGSPFPSDDNNHHQEEVRLLHEEVAELEAKKDRTVQEIQRASKAFLVDAEQMDAHLR